LNLVADAGVAIKWFFRMREDEADVEAALELLREVRDDRVKVVQLDIEMRLGGNESAHTTALRLSVRLQHQLFDTLYQALALEGVDGVDGVLVTADERYFRKAKGLGRIVRLADFGA